MNLFVLIPKFSGGLSFLGSSSVILDVFLDPAKRQTSYHRLVLGISVSDALSSITLFLSTWVMPSDKPSIGAAYGTEASCSAFGFIGQFGTMGATLYNVALMTYYLLMLKYGWSTGKLKNVEPFLHLFALTTTSVVAIYGLAKDLYGSVFYVCWVKTETPDAYAFALLFIPIWVSLIYMVTAMTMVYFAVRNSESRSKLPSFVEHEEHKRSTRVEKETLLKLEQKQRQEENKSSDDEQQQLEQQQRISEAEISEMFRQMQESDRKSKRIMIHAFMYLGAFLITWTFATTVRIYDSFVDYPSYALLIFSTIFTPLQGLFNCLIYFRYKIARCFDRNRSEYDEDYMEVTLRDDDVRDENNDSNNGNENSFNFNEWIAGRDKTGLGGRHFDDANNADNVVDDHVEGGEGEGGGGEGEGADQQNAVRPQ